MFSIENVVSILYESGYFQKGFILKSLHFEKNLLEQNEYYLDLLKDQGKAFIETPLKN